MRPDEAAASAQCVEVCSIPDSPASAWRQSLPWVLLLLLCVGTPIVYRYLTHYNLPVASNMDERINLGVFTRFHQGSGNPGSFTYPTLYLYLTQLLILPFGFAKVLVLGRAVNLAFVGLTGWLAYRFCVRHFQSQAAGLLSAVLVVTSPTLLTSGSYLCTDVLLAATMLAALDALTVYFAAPSWLRWAIVQVLIGLAVGCKYTAFLLWIAMRLWK